MKLSIHRWSRRQTATALGAVAGVHVVALLLTVLLPSASIEESPFWFWSTIGLIGVVTISSLRAGAFGRRAVSEIEQLKERAGSIAQGAGGETTTVAASGIAIAELATLAQAIDAISSRARADVAAMKRLEQVRSEFLGNVSHELRTPIFSVQGYLETLLDGAADDEEVRDEFLEKAHSNLLRLHSLLNDLIEISRIESGEMKMSFRYFDLHEHLKTIVAKLRPAAADSGITLTLDVIDADEEGKLLVFGDRKRLEQAIVNLIDNAIKYNRPEGSVAVVARAKEETVEVSVTDTGFGIPEEHIDRIFERFYRVDKGRSRAVGGSGLGLAIVKHIIEAHNSSISVESVPEVGTTFRFSLLRGE